MLRHLNRLKGHDVIGADCRIGRVDAFHFDDAQWRVRYFVVDTEGSLPRPKLLVSPHAMEQSDWDGGRLTVNLSRGHVESSPEITINHAVPREHEIACVRHFGWPEWWNTVTREGQAAGEPSLRIAKPGYGIEAINRHIGSVDDFIVDENSWEIRYLAIHTEGWEASHRLLLPPSWITCTEWQNDLLTANLRYELTEMAPPWDMETPITREFEERLYAHYGRPGYWER